MFKPTAGQPPDSDETVRNPSWDRNFAEGSEEV
jgi:hypothetical protein